MLSLTQQHAKIRGLHSEPTKQLSNNCLLTSISKLGGRSSPARKINGVSLPFCVNFSYFCLLTNK